MKVQSDNLLNTDALLDPNRLDQSRIDVGQQARGLAADAIAPIAERSPQEARDPGEDVLQANVWPDASTRSLAHFASGLDVGAIAPDAQTLERTADAILAGLVD